MNAKTVLKGNLEFVGLAELLQQLGGNANSGVLKLVSNYADKPGYIYLKNGDPVDAEYGTVTGIDAFNGFFGWEQAEFEFVEEQVARDRVIKKSRMELILDGLRMVDEGSTPKVGPGQTGKRKGRYGGSELPILKGPVVDYVYVVDEEIFDDGQEVVAQNRFGNWFWVILDGIVEVVRILPEGRAPILRLSEGAYIGSIVSFLRAGNVRSASIYAIGQVQLGVLDSDLVAREYSTLSDLFQTILVSIDSRLRSVTTVCAQLVLDPGSVAGKTPEGTFYIGPEKNENLVQLIEKGSADVYINTKIGRVLLMTLGPGDILGRVAFLNTAHEPYSAEVYISRDFAAQDIEPEQIEQEYEELSVVFRNMVQNMTDSISVTTGRIYDLIQKAKRHD
ncbi:MAG: cyclic nucleotide-binding domain-containing protein [Desulfobacteraceae bacterium]|nr:cyclic nucleotide-binding domain-containing protein [Desulfobacteraceae bacterium]